jgi:hypothetical protein
MLHGLCPLEKFSHGIPVCPDSAEPDDLARLADEHASVLQVR